MEYCSIARHFSSKQGKKLVGRSLPILLNNCNFLCFVIKSLKTPNNERECRTNIYYYIDLIISSTLFDFIFIEQPSQHYFLINFGRLFLINLGRVAMMLTSFPSTIIIISLLAETFLATSSNTVLSEVSISTLEAAA